MKGILLVFFCWCTIQSNSQVFVESFDDGNFTHSPAWSGASWTVASNSGGGPNITGSNTLRLNMSGAGNSYLSTRRALWGNTQAWAFWIGRTALADAQNRSFVWLFADKSDLTDATINGYRISLGTAGDDALVLERVTNGVSEEILASSGEIPNSVTDFGIRIRVTRSSLGLWQIFTAIDPGTITQGGGDPANASPVAISLDQGSELESNIGGNPIPIPFAAIRYFGFQAIQNATPSQQIVAAEFDEFHFEANGLLPVTFTTFQVIKDNEKARLTWNVAQEQNVDGYEVERSANGVQFTKIGFVKASGVQVYQFTDEKVLPGTNFYRVKNLDIDGRFGYTHIVSINGRKGQFLKLFPIPARTDLYIQYHQPISGAQLRITTMDGKVVRIMNVPVNSSQTILDLSTFQAGFYFVSYDAGDGNKFVSKFVKQ